MFFMYGKYLKTAPFPPKTAQKHLKTPPKCPKTPQMTQIQQKDLRSMHQSLCLFRRSFGEVSFSPTVEHQENPVSPKILRNRPKSCTICGKTQLKSTNKGRQNWVFRRFFRNMPKSLLIPTAKLGCSAESFVIVRNGFRYLP